MKMLPGLMGRNNIRACQGHRAALCKASGEHTQKLKAVVRVYRSLFCLSVEKERFGYGS